MHVDFLEMRPPKHFSPELFSKTFIYCLHWISSSIRSTAVVIATIKEQHSCTLSMFFDKLLTIHTCIHGIGFHWASHHVWRAHIIAGIGNWCGGVLTCSPLFLRVPPWLGPGRHSKVRHDAWGQCEVDLRTAASHMRPLVNTKVRYWRLITAADELMLFYCYFLAQVECVLWQVCLFLVLLLSLSPPA